MELEDFFNFKDFFRTMLMASALFFIIGTTYGIMLHAMFASQVINVKQDLIDIHDTMENRAEQAYAMENKSMAREWKDIAQKAEKLSKEVNPPPVTPNSYTYFNYWVASAAFTTLKTDNEILGMDEKTREAFDSLDNEMILGSKGWWDRKQFNIYSTRTNSITQLLGAKPELRTYFWTFYIFVLLIGFSTAYLTIKEEYEIQTLPEVLYGMFMPLPFFIIFAFISMLAHLGLGFLHPSQVNLMAVLVSFVTMSILCVIASLSAVFIRTKVNEYKTNK